MNSANNFGPLSNQYKLARRGYPTDVYDYLKSLVNGEQSLTLDLGCGTGLSTGELKENGFDVVGVDKEEEMIAVAKKENPNIAFEISPANSLPFPDNHFDLVTAFTAFHWFNDIESLTEIKRIIKPGGLFFAALKGNQDNSESNKFIKGYSEILKKYTGPRFDSTNKHSDKSILKEMFKDIAEKSFLVEEKYSVKDSLVLLQSLSLWNLVPENKREGMLEEMREFFESRLEDGFVVRRREIFTVAARKGAN